MRTNRGVFIRISLAELDHDVAGGAPPRYFLYKVFETEELSLDFGREGFAKSLFMRVGVRKVFMRLGLERTKLRSADGVVESGLELIVDRVSRVGTGLYCDRRSGRRRIACLSEIPAARD
jgi:hypothetical protein